MTEIRDYDMAVTLIADADYITKGRLLGGDRDGDAREYGGEPEAGPSSSATAAAGPSSGSGVGTFHARQSTTQHYSDEDRRKIEHGQSRLRLQFFSA